MNSIIFVFSFDLLLVVEVLLRKYGLSDVFIIFEYNITVSAE